MSAVWISYVKFEVQARRDVGAELFPVLREYNTPIDHNTPIDILWDEHKTLCKIMYRYDPTEKV